MSSVNPVQVPARADDLATLSLLHLVASAFRRMRNGKPGSMAVMVRGHVEVLDVAKDALSVPFSSMSRKTRGSASDGRRWPDGTSPSAAPALHQVSLDAH